MSFDQFLFRVQHTGFAQLISKSDHLVEAGLQVVHVGGFILLLAALVVAALRRLGHLLPEHTAARLARDVQPLFWWGLGLALGSGVLMFVASPLLYAHKWAFQLKLALLLLAVLVQCLVTRRLIRSDARATPAVRLGVTLSLCLWFGIALAGRLIGFT